jgi:hypothetical protein
MAQPAYLHELLGLPHQPHFTLPVAHSRLLVLAPFLVHAGALNLLVVVGVLGAFSLLFIINNLAAFICATLVIMTLNE